MTGSIFELEALLGSRSSVSENVKLAFRVLEAGGVGKGAKGGFGPGALLNQLNPHLVRLWYVLTLYLSFDDQSAV